MSETQKKEDDKKFQKNKILSLNKFFMKNIGFGIALLVVLYVISFVFLFILLNTTSIDDGLKISLISMIATYILTTSKSVMDKIITNIKYLLSVLGNEQRGLNKNIGIDVDKVDFDDIESHVHEEDS